MSEVFNKDHPFLAPLVDRFRLCDEKSLKQTYHLTFDLEGSGMTYAVGDSVGIFPLNDKAEVEKILSLLKARGDEEVVDKRGQKHLFKDFLLRKGSIDTVTQKLFSLAATKHRDLEPSALKVYLETLRIWDFLEENGTQLTPQQLVECMLPLMPRFYSVASSQKVDRNLVDLTVADTSFVSNGHQRHGVCSRYICHEIELNQEKIPLFVQPAHAFSLTEDLQAPLIMIGPGTGVAPYRGFMQERVLTKASHENWLFFGEKHGAENFYYQTFWEDLVEKGQLKLTCAFSRDQTHKIYVQHRMKEHGAELFDWLERGAYLYVCGDAKRMAKDVEAVLLEIVAEFGKKTLDEAKAYLKHLRGTKRYQRDVY